MDSRIQASMVMRVVRTTRDMRAKEGQRWGKKEESDRVVVRL